DRGALLLADLNWQLVNGLAYFAKVIRPEIAYAGVPRVLLYAPALIHDNLAMGRDVVLTERAQADLARAYGPLVQARLDPRARVQALSDVVRDVQPGTGYVLSVLRPTREHALDRADLARATQFLTGRPFSLPEGAYAALAGVAGQPPVLAW